MTDPAWAKLARLAREATNGWACYAKRKIEHDDIARLHREIDTAVKEADVSSWRPIASAPKDGTPYLGVRIDDEGKIWSPNICAGDWSHVLTHWMPLPPAPPPEPR